MTSVSGDLAGNLTSVQVVSGSTTTTVNYVYDAVTGRQVETWTGTSHGSAMTDTRYGYDAQGRLASASILKQQGAAPSLTVSAIPFYDAVGDSITPSSNYPTTLYSYDADGNTTKVAFPNGTETDTDYSSFWTATGTGGVFGTETITNKRGGTTLSSFVYSFDADRRKISDLETMTDVGESTSNTQKYTWTYDALSRLTSETYDYGNDDVAGSLTGRTTDDYTKTYTFDLDGNRISQTLDISSDNGISGHTAEQVIEYTYNADNELTLEETDNYDGTVGSPITTTAALQYKNATAYDANGSPLSLTHTDSSGTTTTTYTYDVLNRMSTYAVGGVTTTYRYEGNGNIFSQTVGAGTPTIYLWDTHNPTSYDRVLEVWTGGSTPLQTYTVGNSVIGQNVSGTVSFFFADSQNTTRQVTAYTPSASTTNGHVTGRTDYDGFGVAVIFRNTTHSIGTASAIGFQGEYIDPVTLMPIMGGREYGPRTGRFWSMDGIKLAAGDTANANLYVFVAGNPINLNDPTGHVVPFTFSDTLITAGLGASLEASAIVTADAALGEAGAVFSEVIVQDIATGELATTLAGGTETEIAAATQEAIVQETEVAAETSTGIQPGVVQTFEQGAWQGTVSIENGVANIETSYLKEASSEQLQNMFQYLKQNGARSAVLDTGNIVNDELAQWFAARAAEGRSLMGGTIKEVAGEMWPRFKIIWDVLP